MHAHKVKGCEFHPPKCWSPLKWIWTHPEAELPSCISHSGKFASLPLSGSWWMEKRVCAKTWDSFQVTMSCRWKCIRGSYPRFERHWSHGFSWYVFMYVCHCQSVWMDALTITYLFMCARMCPHAFACSTLYRWDQLRCMIRCRAAFRLHDFDRSTSPVGALEVQQTTNVGNGCMEYYGAATEAWFSHSRSADLPTWLIGLICYFCMSTTFEVGTGALWAPWY